MRKNCKKCKRNLNRMGIKLLEGKITKIVCKCEDEAKAKYFKEFDEFISRLGRENGLTNY